MNPPPLDVPAAASYLDTATMGVPTPAAAAAVRAGIEDWASGSAYGPGFDSDVDQARAAFAALVGGQAANVAIGTTLSGFAGLVAGSLPAGSVVLAAEEDFTSLLYPFMAAPGVTVRLVPLASLLDSIDASVSLVAVSAAQSADGRVIDLAALSAAADAASARVFLDATQACGWLPIDASAFAWVAAGAYKWMLAPRGAALMHVSPDRAFDIVPLTAGWYSNADPWGNCYGGPLRVGPGARALDVSPAWICWVGAAVSLAELAALSAFDRAHGVRLADRFRASLGLPPTGSAIVALDRPGADACLERAGIRAAVRAGFARLAFHVYTRDEDVDRALEALA